MKATGIVRRADDLDRIIIPKEICLTLRSCGGDPLLKTEVLMGDENAAEVTGS